MLWLQPKESAMKTLKECCEEEIRKLAYKKWEEAGCPVSDGVQFWLEAEADLSADDNVVQFWLEAEVKKEEPNKERTKQKSSSSIGSSSIVDDVTTNGSLSVL